MRTISADRVWRLCEVAAARDDREDFKEFGFLRTDWESVEASFGAAMPAQSPALHANLSDSLPRSPAGRGESVRAAAHEQGADVHAGGFPVDVYPPGGCGRRSLAAKDSRVAYWNVRGCSRRWATTASGRGKLRVLRELVDTNDAVGLQWCPSSCSKLVALRGWT